MATATTAEFTVIELDPAGYDSGSAAAINDAGQVVGTVQNLPYGAHSAFVWDSTDGTRTLGSYAGRPTVGAGINEQGDVVGTATGSVYNPGFAIVWGADGEVRRLDGPFAGSAGRAINAGGEVACVSGTPPRAVRWTATW